ncbi:MAG: hypothetical protein OEV30_09920 [Ignavibacteria bacterium]|nr:hypothetical protein [Ignavibacteria bacterium]
MKRSTLFIPFLLIITMAIPGCKDEDNPANGGGGSTVVPITADLFPLTVGHKLTYGGFATAPNGGAMIPDPTGSYRSVWTIASNAAPTPLGGTATAVVDSTTGPFGPGGVVVTVSRTLLLQKDSAGDFLFMQTIGPFKRAFGIPVGTTGPDTLIWVAVARPSHGVGATGMQWTAYDSSFTGTGGVAVRLEIFGVFEATEVVNDNTVANDGPATERLTYRSRTWRRITAGGTVVQDDATTSILWLGEDLGPVKMRLVEDTENIGHDRTLSAINF